MADYYSILATAVAALDPNTATTRRELYDRARSAMISKLEAEVPPFNGADIAAAKINFESAVTRLEAEAVLRDIIAPSTRGAGAGGGRTERQPASYGAPARETWLTDLLERASNGAGKGESFATKRD